MIKQEDLDRTIEKHREYPSIDILKRPDALETCNVILKTAKETIKKTECFASVADTTRTRVSFEQLHPERYVGKVHMLALYDYLGVELKMVTPFHYRAKAKCLKSTVKKRLAAANGASSPVASSPSDSI